ncbi:MAG: hypothetical protein A2Y15_06595 [Clostridiales bacterium GWF2_36_10]|nr:MAG: hypothetical protein A2Y15_06595 [Clostridiales bacterium GWF2_36_10]HAN20621.1 hypothetical protein [Clostridiales bacterium]
MGGESDKNNGSNSTIMDTLLKFITIEKLGVNLQNTDNVKQVTVLTEPIQAELGTVEMQSDFSTDNK